MLFMIFSSYFATCECGRYLAPRPSLGGLPCKSEEFCVTFVCSVFLVADSNQRSTMDLDLLADTASLPAMISFSLVGMTWAWNGGAGLFIRI